MQMVVFSPAVSFPDAAAVLPDWLEAFPTHEKTTVFSAAAPVFLLLQLPPVLPAAYPARLPSVSQALAAFFSFPALLYATPVLVL